MRSRETTSAHAARATTSVAAATADIPVVTAGCPYVHASPIGEHERVQYYARFDDETRADKRPSAMG